MYRSRVIVIYGFEEDGMRTSVRCVQWAIFFETDAIDGIRYGQFPLILVPA